MEDHAITFIINIYKHMRKSLQKQGKLKKVKAIKDRESRIVKDINHKSSKALVDFAKENNACIVMEDLKEIRQTAKTGKRQRYSLHSWSFYQQKKEHDRIQSQKVWGKRS